MPYRKGETRTYSVAYTTKRGLKRRRLVRAKNKATAANQLRRRGYTVERVAGPV